MSRIITIILMPILFLVFMLAVLVGGRRKTLDFLFEEYEKVKKNDTE